MNDMEPQHNLMPPGQVDHEGAMAKADLYKIANYSVKLFKKIDDNAQMEAWVQAKITKAADYIASVYHYIEYEMKFTEFGAKLENAEMYSESEKLELKNKLNEAREMLRTLKLAQAQKLDEARSPKAKKDWDGDGKIESDKDEVWGSRMKAAKKAGKMEESWDDDDEDPDVKKADSELKKKGVKLPAVKHKEVPIKKTAKDKEEELDEGSGPYQLSDPKHPKFKATYEKFKKANPDKKLADFVDSMKKKDKAGLEESWDDDDSLDADLRRKSEPSEEDIRPLALKLAKGEISYEEFKKAVDGMHYADYSMRRGEMGMWENWDDDDEDPDVKKADSELKKRGVKLPKVKHKEVPIKKTAKDKEEELDEGAGMDTARRYARYTRKVGMLGMHPGKDGSTEKTRSALTKRAKEYDDPTLRNFDVPSTDTVGAKKFRKDKTNEGSKPDFLDLDKDGNKKEPMKKAAKDKKCKESVVTDAVKRAKKIEESENDPDRTPPVKVHGKASSVVDTDDSYHDKHWWDDDADAVKAGNELKKMGKGWSPVAKRPKTEKPKEKETVKESAEFDRMKEFLTRLNG